MKRKLNGFTLVELIVVIAVFSILMTAIVQCFRPIRETYVDSTLYESRRTAQNGIIKYISESIRYSTDLGLYVADSSTDGIDKAVQQFADAYVAANQITDSTEAGNARQAIYKKAEVIVIDNAKDYAFGSKTDYRGRIVRRKTGTIIASADDDIDSGTPGNAAKCRLALGKAYYGASDYSITLEIDTETNADGDVVPTNGIKVKVASKGKVGTRELQKGEDPYSSSNVISVSGLVYCPNLQNDKSTFDVSDFAVDAAHGNYAAKSNASGRNTKVYIVYLEDKLTEKDIHP